MTTIMMDLSTVEKRYEHMMRNSGVKLINRYIGPLPKVVEVEIMDDAIPIGCNYRIAGTCNNCPLYTVHQGWRFCQMPFVEVKREIADQLTDYNDNFIGRPCNEIVEDTFDAYCREHKYIIEIYEDDQISETVAEIIEKIHG